METDVVRDRFEHPSEEFNQIIINAFAEEINYKVNVCVCGCEYNYTRLWLSFFLTSKAFYSIAIAYVTPLPVDLYFLN